MNPILINLGLIVFAWFMTLILQLFAVPVIVVKLRNVLFDAGWAFGRLVSWLSLGLPIWFLAHFQCPVNNQPGLFIVFFLWAALSWRTFHKNKDEIVLYLQEKWPWLLAEEVVFAFGFFFFSLMRGFAPDILDLEKFMDMGLMASYLRADTFPVLDMWFAGETMNYYTFGHFLGSIMTRFWSVPLHYSYNLLLGLVFGLTMVHSFGFVLNLLQRSGDETAPPLGPLVWGGAVGAFLIVFAGNSHAIWYGIKNHGWQGYWYPDATRFIPYTIHEFPAYSFIVSDLHAHVWNFPLVIALLTAIFLWYRAVLISEQPRRIYLRAFFVSLMFSICFMTSAWDGGIYALLLGVCGVSLLMFYPKRFRHIAASLGLMGCLSALISSAWWLHFRPISEGVGIVETSTHFWQMLIVWGGLGLGSFLAFSIADHQNRHLIYMAHVVKRRKQAVLGLVMALIAAAWILILLPELIYVKDIYPNHPRANTMFKFTLQSYIFMCLSTGWASGFIWLKEFLPHNKYRLWIRGFLSFVLIVVVSSLLIYPYFGYRDRYGQLKNFKGLDGLTWLKEKYPDDYAAVLWLNQNVSGQAVILEAVGTSYSEFSRISAFTGLPTVVGWPVHEWLWRGSYDIPGSRIEEVRRMYENPVSYNSAMSFEKYLVDYIFVGAKEREAYPELKERQLRALGKVIFEQGDTLVVKRNISPAMYPIY